ncbi:unnamed protein product, partial [Ectocarpus sp. 12 AP-2014]
LWRRVPAVNRISSLGKGCVATERFRRTRRIWSKRPTKGFARASTAVLRTCLPWMWLRAFCFSRRSHRRQFYADNPFDYNITHTAMSTSCWACRRHRCATFLIHP